MRDIVAIRLLILGSCVSRDILEHQAQQDGQLKLVDYYARSSLASLAAIPFGMPLPSCLDSIESAFQLRMVQRDMHKSFYDDLKNVEYDLLLIDLIDERFNLWADLAGCVCTLSSELVQTGFRSQYQVGKEIVSGSDEFWNLWETGWTFFVQELSALGALDRIRVNKVFWSDTTQGGGDFGGMYTPQRIASANKLLERMYHRIAQDIPAHQFLIFDKHHLRAADGHKWGISPFHYVADYYAAAIRQLIHNTTSPRADMEPETAHANMGEVTATAYDIPAWKMPVHQYDSIKSAINEGINSDGIHRIAIAGNRTLDLCAQDLPLLDSNGRDRVILIGLSGAVSGRNGKKAPFFSGLGIARSLGLPIIAVSDPTLAMDPDLPLSWYAGNEKFPDLPKQLARVLDGLARKHQARLVVFGGSGGGFAALLLATLLECRATVLVWNPQTAIADYVPEFVTQYIKVVFPMLREMISRMDTEPKERQHEILRMALDATTITHDVRGIKLRPGVDLLYLQNQSDWHVARHAKPYFDQGTPTCVDQAPSMGQNKQIGVFFGQWGEGHAAPPKQVLEAVLRKMAEAESLTMIVQALEGGLESQVVGSRMQLEVSARSENSKVYATCAIGQVTYGATFAFYLLANGGRCAVRWYETNPECCFDLSGVSGRLEVVAFVRDGLGGQVSARVPVEMLDVGGKQNAQDCR